MTGTHEAPGTDSTAHHDGNAADVHYLEHTRAMLGPIMAASNAAAVQGTDLDLRALARLAFSEQTDQLASARLEMVDGVSHTARPIAEAAIHKQDRRLAALHQLFPPALATKQAVPRPGSVQRSQD